MKKLIVFSVILVLLASTAFAADVGVALFGGVNVAAGSTEEDSKVVGNGGFGRIRLEASSQNDDGTFGGWIRYDAGGNWGGAPNGWGLVWWKPVEQVKIQVGNNPDNSFTIGDVTRWGFYQMAGDLGIVNAGNAWGGGWGPVASDQVFYGGYGGFGLLLTISPIDALAINIILPYGADTAEVADIFQQITAQVTYNIDGIGRFALTYKNGLSKKSASSDYAAGVTYGNVFTDTGTPTVTVTQKPANGWADGTVVLNEWTTGAAGDPGRPKGNSDLYVSFLLTAVENLELDLGFHYTITDGDKEPMGIGLGAKYDAGAFGVKARILARLAGEDKSTALTADVLPYFAVSDSLKAYLSVGLGLWKPDTGDSVTAWHIAPYIEYGFDWSKGFWAGVNISSPGKVGGADAEIYWSIPIGLYFSF